jgi:hypothetical protein
VAERPTDEEIAKWHRWFAIEANNRAWQLTELAEPTDDQRNEARLAAYASLYHWDKVGTDEHRALAEMLLARAHVLAHEPAHALRYAHSGYCYFSSRKSEPWQMAFAHALMADASALAGRPEEHREHYNLAREIGNALGEGDRSIFHATFQRVPEPAHG